MHFQKDLRQLILNKSPQVTNLRERAINGNKQTLQLFSNVIKSLLKQPNTQPLAYVQTNYLLISAHEQIVSHVYKNILGTLLPKHERKQLDQYIIFWKRILTKFAQACPNNDNNQMLKKLQSIKIWNQNRQLSNKFGEFNRIFQQNLQRNRNQKVQFFQSFEQESLASSSILEETESEIMEFNILQINQIRNRLQNQPDIHNLVLQQYAIKAINFVNLKPKHIKNQLVAEYNENIKWAKDFLANHQKQIPANMVKSKNRKQKEPPEIRTQLQSLPERKILHQNNFMKNKPQHKQKQQQQQQIGLLEEGEEDDNLFILVGNQAQQLKINDSNFVNKRTASRRFQLVAQNKQHQNSRTKQILPIQNQNIKMLKKQHNDQKQLNNHYSVNIIKGGQNLYEHPRFSSPQFEPKFILSTQQMKIIQKQSPQLQNNSSRIRKSIFNPKHIDHNNRSIKQNIISPKQQDLIIKKHGYGQTQKHHQNQHIDYNNETNYYQTPFNNLNKNNITPAHRKTQRYEFSSHSPNTAFQTRTKDRSAYKKLSQFTQQKRQRKQCIANQQLTPIEDYLLLPYIQNFKNMLSFNKFRRNCFEEYFTIYSSPDLSINCLVQNVSYNKIKIQLSFQNKTNANLLLQTVYRVPRSMKVQKYSQIKKKWILVGGYKHSFGLNIVSFPVQPCIINLRYIQEQRNEYLKQKQIINLLIPATISNFLRYLVLNQQQWIQKWRQWSQISNTKLVRNIVLQNNVINDNELISVLKFFTPLQPIQGYSVKQFGGFCTQENFKDLVFLLRISQRVDNIMTIQLLANKRVQSSYQIDFLSYCLNIWSMLLAKIQVYFGE